MNRYGSLSRGLLLAAVALCLGVGVSGAASNPFDIARIYIEYNSTDNDLGFHVLLDGVNWKTLKMVNPVGKTIMEIAGKAGYAEMGLTELFFEGAEPNLEVVPLRVLLGKFPEGNYKFYGITVDGKTLYSTSRLSHAIPEGPDVSSLVKNGEVIIMWDDVDEPPDGFPNRNIEIVGYQVIVGSFQVTLPASAREVELPDEFVENLEPGEHDYEVLAIDRRGNQTITSDSFELE